ncbi:hypothetical protein ACHAXS_001360 [Conticribra weissflogii]
MKFCNARWDKTASKVSINATLSADAKKFDPLDPRIIESMCYTGIAEFYLFDKFQCDEAFGQVIM